MGFNRKVKELIVDEVQRNVSSYGNFVVVDFSKVGASKMDTIRKEFAKSSSTVRIIKNSTAKFLFKKMGYEAQKMDGMSALIFGADSVEIAKKLAEIQTREKSFKFKYAIVDKKVASEKDIQTLSKLPSRNELLVGLLYTFKAPVSSFVMLCNELTVKFIRLLDVYKDEKNKSTS